MKTINLENTNKSLKQKFQQRLYQVGKVGTMFLLAHALMACEASVDVQPGPTPEPPPAPPKKVLQLSEEGQQKPSLNSLEIPAQAPATMIERYYLAAETEAYIELGFYSLQSCRSGEASTSFRWLTLNEDDSEKSAQVLSLAQPFAKAVKTERYALEVRLDHVEGCEQPALLSFSVKAALISQPQPPNPPAPPAPPTKTLDSENLVLNRSMNFYYYDSSKQYEVIEKDFLYESQYSKTLYLSSSSESFGCATDPSLNYQWITYSADGQLETIEEFDFSHDAKVIAGKKHRLKVRYENAKSCSFIQSYFSVSEW